MLKLVISLALITNMLNGTPYIQMKENIKIVENELRTEIKLKEEKVTLLYFYATWCGPCQKLSPVINNIKETYQGMDVTLINVDENRDLVNQYGVNRYPTTIILKNGEEKERIIGFMEQDKIMEKILVGN